LLGIGIGGNTKTDGDVSWKQNRNYELMLRRLNASGGDNDDDDDEESVRVSMVPAGFVRAVEGTMTDEKDARGVSVEEVDEKERKRQRKEQRRKEKAAAKAKAKAEEASTENDASSLGVAPSSAITIMDAAPVVSPPPPVPSAKPPRRLAYVVFYYL
jgi:hypothetical protein